MRALLTLLLVLILTPLSAGLAWSQVQTTDDRDIDLFDMFITDPRDGDTISQTPVIDMETDNVGRLLVAYGNMDAYEGTAWVDVVVRKKDLTWLRLARDATLEFQGIRRRDRRGDAAKRPRSVWIRRSISSPPSARMQICD